MDLVTLAAACAIGVGSPLFAPLDMHRDCAGPADAGSLAVQDRGSSAVERWTPLIGEASRRFDIPADWLRDVMRAESGGHEVLNGAPITSPADAMGLMQITPDTFADLSARYDLGNDPFDPRANIFAGAAYLREMYDRFGTPGFLAAYNAGPDRLTELLRVGRALPAETRQYLEQTVGALSADLPPVVGPSTSGPSGAPALLSLPANIGTSDGLFASRRASAASIALPSNEEPSGGLHDARQASRGPGSSSAEGLFVVLGMRGAGG